MSSLNTKEVHERRHRRIFDMRELESIISNIVHHEIADQAFPGVVEAVDYKLTCEDQTEGSPSYKVGMKCIVDVVERLSPHPNADEGERK
jgi:hypothetical protein